MFKTILLWNEKMEDKKLIQKARNIFTSLKTGPNSVLFSEEKIDEQLFKKFKKAKYVKDSLFLKLILLADNRLEDEKKKTNKGWFYQKTGNRQVDFI